MDGTTEKDSELLQDWASQLTTLTEQQIRSMLNASALETKTGQTAALLMDALGEAIKSMTEVSAMGGVPVGHLYAVVADKVSIDTFSTLIAALTTMKVIKRDGMMLSWISAEQEMSQ